MGIITDIFRGAANQAIDVFQGQVPVGFPPQRTTILAPMTQASSPVSVIPGTGGPMIPNIPISCDGGPAPVYKKVNGIYKWVKPKRRRRRKLITESDARGLAQLKGIVGNGKVMEVWIATHGG